MGLYKQPLTFSLTLGISSGVALHISASGPRTSKRLATRERTFCIRLREAIMLLMDMVCALLSIVLTTPLLTHGDISGHGHTTFLNQNYETILELRAGNHRLTDKHEFTIVNETTALIQIYHPVPWNLTAYGGSDEQQWIVDARFQGVLLPCHQLKHSLTRTRTRH